MSQENVEIVQSLYRPADPSRFFDLLDDRVQLDASQASLLPDQSELIRGKEAVLDFFRRYWGTWDEYVLKPAEIIDADQDRVVVAHYERGSGKGSGVPFERRWAVVYTLSAGQLVRIDQFATREQALEAAGLSE